MRRSNRQFYYFILDDDKKLFNCIGSISNDNDWNQMVVDAQKSGRNIHSSSVWEEEGSESSKDDLENRGYKYSEKLLVHQPVDRSAEYSHSLPQYAGGADKNKIVQFLCHDCRVVRYGEMNTNYPGQEILMNSNLGDYTARCLKCGSIANDPYNWYR